MKKVHPFNSRDRKDGQLGDNKERVAETEAEKMDRAIRALLSSPEEAPMSAEQIAAFYDDDRDNSPRIDNTPDVGDARSATKKSRLKPELLEDDDCPPLPPEQIGACCAETEDPRKDQAAEKTRRGPEVIEDGDSLPLSPVQIGARYDEATEDH